MRPHMQNGGPSVLLRITVTLVLLIVSLVLLMAGAIQIDGQLIGGVVAGLLVLATAGIWISFFAEREAQRTVFTTAEGIRQATELSRACVETGLLHIFPSSDDEAYHHFVSDRLLRAHRRSEIRVAGIASRGFFHADGGPNNPQIKQLAAREVPMRVILLHPFFEPAISRAIREDNNRKYFDEHIHSILAEDVIRSCEGIVGLGANSIQTRLCSTAVSCRLTFIGDILIFEPHHFGSAKQRASMATPVFVFRIDAAFSRRLSDHFEFLWEISESFAVSADLVKDLRSQWNSQGDLRRYMRICRPDLFPAGVGAETSNVEPAPAADVQGRR